MNSVSDAYKVLGLQRRKDLCTVDEIRESYYRLVKEHHPDHHHSQNKDQLAAAEAKIKDINTAYEVLVKEGGHQRALQEANDRALASRRQHTATNGDGTKVYSMSRPLYFALLFLCVLVATVFSNWVQTWYNKTKQKR